MYYLSLPWSLGSYVCYSVTHGPLRSYMYCGPYKISTILFKDITELAALIWSIAVHREGPGANVPYASRKPTGKSIRIIYDSYNYIAIPTSYLELLVQVPAGRVRVLVHSLGEPRCAAAVATARNAMAPKETKGEEKKAEAKTAEPGKDKKKKGEKDDDDELSEEDQALQVRRLRRPSLLWPPAGLRGHIWRSRSICLRRRRCSFSSSARCGEHALETLAPKL